ncbi:MAG: signal peptidase I [Aeromicrobium sp.]
MSRTHTRPRRSLAARAGSGLLSLFAILATLAGVAYIAPSLVGYERYVITGGSMSGTFEKGSVAVEKPVPVAEIGVGDVITYLPPADSGVTQLVTHRIISDTVLEDGTRQLQTQGDANPDPDPWKFSLTEGTQPVVSFTVPHVGWAFVALADRETRMMIIGVPAGLIALASLVELARAVGGDRRVKRHGTAGLTAAHAS